MKPETRFWHWLSGGALPPGDYSRVEPPPTPGIPDVNYCIEGIEGWIELKVGRNRRCPFNGRNKGLRASQRRWMRNRLRYNGRVFVLVAVGPWIYLFRAKEALLLTAESTLDDFQRLALCVQPRRITPELTANFKYVLTNNEIYYESYGSDASFRGARGSSSLD